MMWMIVKYLEAAVFAHPEVPIFGGLSTFTVLGATSAGDAVQLVLGILAGVALIVGVVTYIHVRLAKCDADNRAATVERAELAREVAELKHEIAMRRERREVDIATTVRLEMGLKALGDVITARFETINATLSTLPCHRGDACPTREPGA